MTRRSDNKPGPFQTVEIFRVDAVDGFSTGPWSGEYADRFWLPVLGPTCLALARHAERLLDTTGAPVSSCPAVLLAQACGIGVSAEHAGIGRSNPIVLAAARLARFAGGAIDYDEPAGRIRFGLPACGRLSFSQISRLPETLQTEHADWLVTRHARPVRPARNPERADRRQGPRRADEAAVHYSALAVLAAADAWLDAYDSDLGDENDQAAETLAASLGRHREARKILDLSSTTQPEGNPQP